VCSRAIRLFLRGVASPTISLKEQRHWRYYGSADLATSSVPPLAETELNHPPDFLKQRPDGLWEDTRYRFGPDTRILITGGPYEGQEAVIDTLAGSTQGDDGNWSGGVGYNARLENGRYVSVQWDRVKSLG
jgi:hypothetical protein